MDYRTNLSILYQNVRGLCTKSDLIYSSLVDIDLEVVAITETWLDEIHTDLIYSSLVDIDLDDVAIMET